ncbi:MAG TPA: pyridoxal-phosphate dependent enzyme, partial [Ktedonobacteraceae bacterium]|nr:pyridoxal-phosphate dependent enzyme [Ktedonobacteraceae bacterium]
CPCLIIIPESGLQRLQFREPLDPCVKIVSLSGFVDYYDAITLAAHISKLDGFFPEGGAKNVARRDGLGTALLNAVETIGQLPDYYFQAIGSGAGAIAVHETAKRLVNDGRFGRRCPRLMLSQNLPFAPIYFSWKAKQRGLISFGRDEGKRQIQQIAAHVLSNQQPPYALRGGVFDVLHESQGDMLVADNCETLDAVRLFRESEGIDIDPAAGVALATLLKAVASGQIDRKALVLLNITGGGWDRNRQDNRLIAVEPALQIQMCETAVESILEKIVRLF